MLSENIWQNCFNSGDCDTTQHHSWRCSIIIIIIISLTWVSTVYVWIRRQQRIMSRTNRESERLCLHDDVTSSSSPLLFARIYHTPPAPTVQVNKSKRIHFILFGDNENEGDLLIWCFSFLLWRRWWRRRWWRRRWWAPGWMEENKIMRQKDLQMSTLPSGIYKKKSVLLWLDVDWYTAD